MKLKCLLLFFVLFSVYVVAQKTRLDSLQQLLLKNSSDDEEQLQLLIAIAEVQRFTIAKEGIITCDRAITLAEKLNSEKNLARALNEKAALLVASAKSDEAMLHLEKAFSINKNLNDKNAIADNYLTESTVYLTGGKQPDKAKECLDKAKELMTGDASPQIKGHLYYNLFFYYQYTNPDTAFILIDKALNFFLQADKKGWVSYTYSGIATLYGLKGEIPKVIEYYNKALEISVRENYYATSSAIYENMAWTYSDMANYPMAADNFIKALKMNELIGDERLQAFELNNIGMTFSNINNFEKAIEYLNRQIPLSKKINDSYSLCAGYEELGNVYLKQKKYKEAIEQFQLAMNVSVEAKDSGRIAECYGLLGDAYEKSGNYQAAFTNLQIAKQFNYKHALYENYCKNLLSLTRTIKNSGTSPLKDSMGSNISAIKKNKLAISYALEALEFGNKYNYNGVRYLVLFELSDSYEREGNLKKSFEYYKQYVQARDSVINNDNLKSIANLQFQYSSEKQEQQIVVLNKDKKIQETEIQKQKSQRNAFIGGFLMVLLLIIVLYNRYRLKQKSNKQLSKTLTELKDTQQQLVQSEKMAAFGLMASRVAHEIQNPLNFVNNFSELAQELVTDVINSESKEDKKQNADILIDNLQKINEHGKRAAGIVKQLQEHTRAGTAHEFFESDKT